MQKITFLILAAVVLSACAPAAPKAEEAAEAKVEDTAAPKVEDAAEAKTEPATEENS